MNFNIHKIRKYFTVVLIAMLVFSCQQEPKSKEVVSPKKPNVVLIIADDQGWGDLSSSGNSNLSTPHIDGLAKYGVSFENFFVQPVCSPTRAEILTGRYFPRLGVYETSAGGERMNLEETTLAEVLRNAGYKTAAYGKWHNGTQPPYHPNARGFEDFYGFTSGHWGNYFSPMLEHNGEIVKGNGFLADDLTDHGLEFIEKNQDNSFFLYLPFNTPHSPMQVPDEYWNRFKDKPLEKLYLGPEQEDLHFTKAALSMVENIDENVGRIMAKLRQLYLEDDTIVIYLSDNGPNAFRWNGDMRGKKGCTDEGGVRSPFYIQWKDSLPEGKKINQIASSIDLLPTITSLVGVPLNTFNPIDGKDLGPLLFDVNPQWNDRLIYNHWGIHTSVRSQKFRLDHENHLYNMENDHGQKADISIRLPQIRDSLIKAKDEWLLEVKPISNSSDFRHFTIGHANYTYTLLPARDGKSHGNIKRSNRFPNDSFFTNWKSVNDSITWDVEVLADGQFEVELYYTCATENVGTIIELGMKNSKIATKITESNDSPIKGMENDRVPRMESYVKDFKPLVLGNMVLKKGKGILTLKALEIPGKDAIDVRLLVFKRKV